MRFSKDVRGVLHTIETLFKYCLTHPKPLSQGQKVSRLSRNVTYVTLFLMDDPTSQKSHHLNVPHNHRKQKEEGVFVCVTGRFMRLLLRAGEGRPLESTPGGCRRA